MKTILIQILLFIILQQVTHSQTKRDIGLIKFGDSFKFLSGVNIAWNNYGWDFGWSNKTTNYADNLKVWPNHGWDAQWWNRTFKQIYSMGANCARIWIHGKGIQSPLFDQFGNVIGLNDGFLQDLGQLIELAKNHRLILILSLWDFLIIRHSLITDVKKTESYIKYALKPILQFYKLKKYDNIFLLEVMNQPEWVWEKTTIKQQQVLRFIAMLTEYIHLNSDLWVSVGSASLKWSSSRESSWMKNYWSDQSLQSVYPSKHAYLDIYQIHYYDWMYEHRLIPFKKGNSPSYWGIDDQVVLIGETGNQTHYSIKTQMETAYDNEYCGILFWAYKSGGASPYQEFSGVMKSFKDKDPTLIEF